MDFENKIYELSLWDDGPDNEEIRRCVIASHTMSSPARAFNINLNKKTNSEKTLTFSIYAKYFDQEICDYVTNPYLGFLTNERKVKLKKEEKGQIVWYDMIIKQVSEDSSNFTYTYTAKDQHIQELAKSGFELEFDKELQNNTGTKEELAREILRGTDWGVGKGDALFEYTKEPISRVELPVGTVLTSQLTGEETTLDEKVGRYVYVPYSEGKKKIAPIQVIYSQQDCLGEKAELAITDEGVLDREIYNNYTIEIVPPAGLLLLGIQGERLVQSQKTVYDKALEQYVKVYSDNQGKKVYSFTRTEYNTPELVENLITNGEGNFIDNSGWYNTTTATRDLAFSPEVQDWTDDNKIESFIKITPEKKVSWPFSVMNSGLFDNRNKLTGFVEGQTYVFKWELFSENEQEPSTTLSSIVICEYDLEDGRYKQKDGGDIYFLSESGLFSPSSPLLLSCRRGVSAKEIKNKKIGIFLTFAYAGQDVSAKIKNCQFYRDIGIEPGSISTLKPNDLIKTHYYYYDPNSDYTKFEDIKFLYEGYEEQSDYKPFYEGYEKKRTITGKESNRYNLLQEICEQFECWLDVEVDHYDNGGIIPNKIENGQVIEYHKRVSFREYIGKKNHAGFKYGVNLKSIKRNIDSNQIVTKMITKDNSNEFAKNGFCSIARAPSNPSGTNVIYNFDYYIGQNLLGAEEVSEALYLTSQGESKDPDFPESLTESDWKNLEDIIFPEGWGLYPKLDDITTKTQTITEKQIGISKNLTSLKASIDYEQARLDGAESSLVELKEDLENLTKYTYEDFLNNHNLEKYEKPETEEQKKHNQFVDWASSDKVKEYKVKIRHLTTEKEKAENNLAKLNNEQKGLPKFELEYNLNAKKLEYYSTQRKKIEEDFYKRYSRFIQEGSWISEDYIDDELYYLDALATGYTSSRPKVTYTIDVFDLAGVEDYENYEFEIGDKTFVQDQEFFGWVQEEIDDPTIPGKKITIKRPYREEVVVNELTEGIDDITKNALKVQNYKTQFDDLFQRIAATTESLQYNTGRYERGAKAVEPDGSISHKALQQAVTENGLAIANAGAQTVTIDEQGVITTDKTLPNKKVRIIGGGIYVTKDGGETWETGITGDGINANIITTGQLNAGEINIMTGDAASHRWDSKGITAYRTNYDSGTGEVLSISPYSFVRLDEFGLYGINSDKEFNARLGTTTTGDEKHGIAKIQRDSLFSLTQDGLTIGKDGYGLKATEEGITIGQSMKINEAEIKISNTMLITKDRISIDDRFIATPDSLKVAGWTVTENMFASSEEKIFLSPSGVNKNDISGQKENINYTIYSNENFGITTEGKLHAQDAWIGGHIEANTGNIGGIEIVPNGIFSKTMLANQEYSSTSLSASFDETTNMLTLFGASDGEGKLVKAYWANEQESTFLLNCRAPYHWYIVDIFRVAGDYSVFKHGNASTVQVPVDKHLIIVVDSIDESVLQVRLSSKFSLDSDGYLYAQNADISGTINANNGTIGGIIIKDGGLTSKQNTSQLEEPEKRRHSSQKNSSTSIKISNYGASDARAVRYYKLTGQDAKVKVTLKKYGKNINLVAIIDEIPESDGTYTCSFVQTIYTGSVLLTVREGQYLLISSDIDDAISDWGSCEVQTTGFSISSSGTITASAANITGVLYAGAGSTIGNFTATENALCFGSEVASKASIFISSRGENATIASQNRSDWTLNIANNFGITSGGDVYATKVYLTGGGSKEEEVYLDYEGVHLKATGTGDTANIPWGSLV